VKLKAAVKLLVLAGLLTVLLAMCAMPVLLRPQGKELRKLVGGSPRDLSLEVRTWDRGRHSYLCSFRYSGSPHGIAFVHQGISHNLLDVNASNRQGFTASVAGDEAIYELGHLTVRRGVDWMFVFYGMNPHDFDPSSVRGDAIVIDGVELGFGSEVDADALAASLGITEPIRRWHAGMD
jgi:hypothetical protein